MKKEALGHIISYLLIFLFVYAGTIKILDVRNFYVQIGQSPMLVDMAGFVAWFIPLTEIGVSLLIAFPVTRLIGLVGAFGLMALFTTYIIAILGFSEHVPCACGGALQSLGWWEHLVFNVVFLLLTVAAILIYGKSGFGRGGVHTNPPIISPE